MVVLEELKKIFTGDKKVEGKNNNFLKNLVVLGMLGILILLFSDLFVNNEPRSQEMESGHEEVIEMDFENKINNQLEEIVGLIKGVGKVKVSVYIRKYTSYEY